MQNFLRPFLKYIRATIHPLNKLNKRYVVLIAVFFALCSGAIAQVSSGYVWSQSQQAYKSDTSTTSVVPASIFVTSWDDLTYTAYKFPFNFTYNGVLYTAGTSTIGLDTDGWIAFAPGAITMSGSGTGVSWVSISDHTGVYLSGTANDNGICGFNSDVEDQVWTSFTGNTTNGSPLVTAVTDFSNLRIGTRLIASGVNDGTVITKLNAAAGTITISSPATTTATAVSITPATSIYAFIRGVFPYRQFVIQWTRVTRYGTAGDDFSFQIVLNEGGGTAVYQTLQAVYGECKATNLTAQNSQVGLRGTSNADFNARKTATNWGATTASTANSDVCVLTPAIFPSSGLTYTWSRACPAAASNAGAITGPLNVCPGTSVDYSIAGVPGAIFYTWTYTGTNTSFSGTSTLPINTFDFGLTATGGTLTVTPGNLCGAGAASAVTITMGGLPSASISYGSAVFCTSAAAVTPTVTGTPGGLFSASPSGLTINTSTGTVTPASSTAGNYLVTYTFTSGCTASVTANITINPPPAIGASGTPNSFCSTTNSSQLLASVGASNYSLSSIPFTSLTPSAGSTIVFNTYQLDNISTGIAMPFAFNYFGSNITQFFVSTEGYVQLQTGTAVQWTPQTLPNATIPNNIIALAWADLIVDPSTNPGSSIRYFVNGVAPNRVLVIDYINLRFLGGGSLAQNVTGQIRLYESNNHIEVAAGTVKDDGDLWNKTMGIENSTGTIALTPPGRNNTIWNVTNEAWSFIPGPSTYNYSWSPGTFLNSTSIANPVATNVNVTTTYTVTVTNTTTGCSATATVPILLPGSMGGIYTVGVGGNFTTLTAAVAAYNGACSITGPITFSLIDNTYPAETFPVTINSNAFASSINTLTIKPASGKIPTLTGSSSIAIIKMFGADYVTIDGSNTTGGSSKDLSIVNTSTDNLTSTIVWLASVAAGNGATNNNIKNCIITGNAATTTFTSVISSGTVVGSIAEAANNNNTYINNNFTRSQTAIAVVGPTGNENNCIISGNIIGSSVAGDKLGWSGIELYQQANAQVNNNTILGITTSNTSIIASGIAVYGSNSASVISGNTISDIKHTSSLGLGANGIYLGSLTTATNTLVYNNFIFDVSGYGFNDFNYYDNGYGLVVDAGGGYKIYYNSVIMNANTTLTGNHRSAALLVSANVTTANSLDIQNNIFDNRQTVGGANSRYAILSTAANTVYANINYNGFYNSGGSNWLLCKGSNATQYNSLALLQTNIGGNANSVAGLTTASSPTYISTTNYHLQSVAANSICTNLGTPISGITIDIDTTTRNGLNPDIGADEWLMPNTGSWVGKTSTDWLVNTNWETNKVPDRNIDVSITGGYTFMPTILTKQAVRGLTLNAPVPANTPILTLKDTLQVFGSITRTGGSIDGINGTFETDSSNSTTIPASLFLNNKLKNLYINSGGSGLTLAGTVDIYRSVAFGPAGFILITGSNLVFKSTATETAWLGVMTGKTISGTATVERYIPTGINHNKTWQLLAVPLKGTTSIKSSWMENNASLVNANPGFGTTLSSEVTGAVGRGWDFYTPLSGSTGGPSIKTYNPATGTWVGIDNGVALTNGTPLIPQPKGYFVFVRGDRSVVTSGGAAVPTVLRASGTLYTPGVNQPPTTAVVATKFATIGNPYASAIDFSLVTRAAGVDNVFYLWDPKLPGSLGLGGYQTIAGITGYKPTPGSVNYPSNTAITTIQSGQAFFVHGTAGGNVSFTEAVKVSGSANVLRQQPVARKLLTLNLYKASTMDLGPVDGNVIVFDKDFSNSFDAKDALKISNTGENIGIYSNEKILAVEARKPINRRDTIFYNMNNLRMEAYQLRFAPERLNANNLAAWLVDRFLDTKSAISLTDSTFIDFIITSDAGSYAANRFYLVFDKVEVLPVLFTSISATRIGEQNVSVGWKAENEAEIVQYEIERSGDGRNFKTLDHTASLNRSNASIYTYADEKALAADNYYRIKAFDRNGEFNYSRIVKVGIEKQKASISIYPNPVVNKILWISFNEQLPGTYNIQLVNNTRQIILKKALQINMNNEVQSIQLGKAVAAGAYLLNINSADGKKTSIQLIIN